MKHRLFALLTTAMMVFAVALIPSSIAAAPAEVNPKPLKNVKVTGTLSDGGTFDGKLRITEMGFDYDNSVLWANGVLKGTAETLDGVETDIEQAFENVPVALVTGSGEVRIGRLASLTSKVNQQTTECPILNLDLGPIFLDLLGLQVDLDEVNLDITAVSGSGNLLGNLLCAVAGLLDSGSPLSNVLNSILNAINSLLG